MSADPATSWSDEAAKYERWWVPVLTPAVHALLDRIELETVDWANQPRRLLDIGTGTGLLALAAVRRWLNVTAVGLDVAPGMLAIAAKRAAAGGDAAGRVSWVEGATEELPFTDDTFDVVAGSFVYQFLLDRRRALSEIARVLRPGGAFAWVTWRAGPVAAMAADQAFEEVLAQLSLEWESTVSPRGRRPASASSAARELRSAGFVNVRAREVQLVLRYDRRTYLDQLEQDDASLTFANADPPTREEIRRRTSERWDRLTDDAFVWPRTLVSVVAQKSGPAQARRGRARLGARTELNERRRTP